MKEFTVIHSTIHIHKHIQVILYFEEGELPKEGDIITYDKFNGLNLYVQFAHERSVNCKILNDHELDIKYVKPGIKYQIISSPIGEYSEQ